MNNQDYTFYFIIMTLLNTSLGITNYSKNDEQDKRNKEILCKLDKILEKLNEK